jgi:hypothetical protein
VLTFAHGTVGVLLGVATEVGTDVAGGKAAFNHVKQHEKMHGFELLPWSQLKQTSY